MHTTALYGSYDPTSVGLGGNAFPEMRLGMVDQWTKNFAVHPYFLYGVGCVKRPLGMGR